MKTHYFIDKATKKQKYKSQKTVIDGIKFDSKRESEYYLIYREMERQGEITDLQLQPVFIINIDKVKICKVILDFSFCDKSGIHYIDVKGFPTALSKLKKRLVEACYKINVEWVK